MHSALQPSRRSLHRVHRVTAELERYASQPPPAVLDEDRPVPRRVHLPSVLSARPSVPSGPRHALIVWQALVEASEAGPVPLVWAFPRLRRARYTHAEQTPNAISSQRWTAWLTAAWPTSHGCCRCCSALCRGRPLPPAYVLMYNSERHIKTLDRARARPTPACSTSTRRQRALHAPTHLATHARSPLCTRVCRACVVCVRAGSWLERSLMQRAVAPRTMQRMEKVAAAAADRRAVRRAPNHATHTAAIPRTDATRSHFGRTAVVGLAACRGPVARLACAIV